MLRWRGMNGYDLWSRCFFTLVHWNSWFMGFGAFLFVVLSPFTFFVTWLVGWNLADCATIWVIWESSWFNSKYDMQHLLLKAFMPALIKCPLCYVTVFGGRSEDKSISEQNPCKNMHTYQIGLQLPALLLNIWC